MPAIDDFLADPPEFMRTNHLVYRGAGPETAGGNSHRFALIPIVRGARYRTGSAFLGMGNKKADAGAFDIRSVAANHPDVRADGVAQFDAIWSGYKAGLAIHCDLVPGGVGIMLTPELTGCTVVWSSRPDGTARFSHYNLKNGVRTLTDDAMTARAQTDYAGDDGFGSMSKGYYRSKGKVATNDLRVTVVGSRSGGSWNFYAQYVENKSGVYQVRGVEALTPGTKEI